MSGENVLRILKTNVDDLSENYLWKKAVVVDPAFIPACRLLNSAYRKYMMPTFIQQVSTPFKYAHDDTKVIAFSGGKVSLACALRYKDIGQKIVLYHIAKTKDDVSRIQQLADMLESPLYIHYESIIHTPFLGMKILQLVTDYAVSHAHDPKVVFGYFDSAITKNNYKYEWSYCNELVECFKQFGQSCIDGYNILNPIPNYAIVWDEILGHKGYLKYLTYKNEEEEKIFQNIRMDYRMDAPDLEIYLSNIEYLKHKRNNAKATINELWNKYFFYRIEKSIFYKEMMEKYVSSI